MVHFASFKNIFLYLTPKFEANLSIFFSTLSYFFILKNFLPLLVLLKAYEFLLTSYINFSIEMRMETE